MGAFAYEDITGKLPNYHKSVIRASAAKYPMLALFDAKGVPVKEGVQQWRLGDAPTPAEPATMSGTDKTGSYVSHQGPIQKACLEIFTTDPWKVDDMAEITDAIGMPADKNEAYQQAQNAEKLTRSINAAFLSAQELQEEDRGAGKPWKIRSMFAWLYSSLQTVAGYGVNSDYQPTGNYDGTLAAYTEELFKTSVQAAAEQVRQRVSLTGHVGSGLKAKMSQFNVKAQMTAATEASVRTITSGDQKKYINMVDFFDVDAGTVQVVTAYDILLDMATGLPGTRSKNSGLFINTDMWCTGWAKPIFHFPLLDQGGGPRGFHKAIGILKCLNPQGQFCHYSLAS